MHARVTTLGAILAHPSLSPLLSLSRTWPIAEYYPHVSSNLYGVDARALGITVASALACAEPPLKAWFGNWEREEKRTLAVVTEYLDKQVEAASATTSTSTESHLRCVV